MKLLRRLLLALLLALLVGLLIGTWLRLRLERAPRYLGANQGSPVAWAIAEAGASSFRAREARGLKVSPEAALPRVDRAPQPEAIPLDLSRLLHAQLGFDQNRGADGLPMQVQHPAEIRSILLAGFDAASRTCFSRNAWRW